MQPATGRRALSYLASKLHPRVPLSERESTQLLNLLTTSFRAHLDRAHPVAPTESDRSESGGQPLPHASKRRIRSVSPARIPSSHLSTRDHIESILTNPLLATRPGRRTSDASKADAQSVLRDPLGWFFDQVAIGAADVSKAAICLQILQRETGKSKPMKESDRPECSKSALPIAKWLQSSGSETWSQFITYDPDRLLHPLTTSLLQEGEDAILWNWFTSTSNTQLSGIDEASVVAFRAQLLKSIVAATTLRAPNIDDALCAYLRAYETISTSRTFLLPAGKYLVNHLLSHSHCTRSPQLYESFLRTVQAWLKKPRHIQCMLWLYHPTEPTALPALAYMRDPGGLGQAIPHYSSSRQRKLAVHLCLETARQLLADKNYHDAMFALQFARDTFPDLVDSKPNSLDSEPHIEAQNDKQMNRGQAALEHRRREEASLKMLDSLLPT